MYYVNTEKKDAAYQFACEEYFLTQKQMKQPVFLLWSTTPTVMLGYYQNAYEELNLPYITSEKIKVVRRNTGGGTIFTDAGGLQFSFIQAQTEDGIDFGSFMTPIIQALNKLGVQAVFNSRNDIEVHGQKISGNAQCTKKGYTLHHGSLLFDTNFAAMKEAILPPQHKIKSKGIKSIRSRVGNIRSFLETDMSLASFTDYLIKEILTGKNETYHLSPADIVSIEDIYQNKFASWDWTMGKNPQFEMKKEQIFPAGKVTIYFDVKKGYIQNVDYVGDFFTHEDLSTWQKFLMGLPYQKNEMLAALEKNYVAPAIHGIDNKELISMMFM